MRGVTATAGSNPALSASESFSRLSTYESIGKCLKIQAFTGSGEVLDVLVEAKRNKNAALKLVRKLLKKYDFVPGTFVTDNLRSYGALAGPVDGWVARIIHQFISLKIIS